MRTGAAPGCPRMAIHSAGDVAEFLDEETTRKALELAVAVAEACADEGLAA